MARVIYYDSKMKRQNIIDKFPEEMLLEIFGFLDLKSLQNVTLVNKRWHFIVTNATSTMKKLPLIIHGDLFRKDDLSIGNRKFYKVVFKFIDKSFNTEILSCLKIIGSNIREIEFIDCCVSKQKLFQNILRNLPNVQKLMFRECSFRFSYQKSNAKVLKLENLKELVLEDSCWTILVNIGAQLKSLKVYMEDEHSEDEAYKQQLMEFLYTQKDSVEILELGSLFSNDIYELILNKFENLKTLSINILDFPADLKRIKVNKKIEKLIIEGEIEDDVKYCAFLNLFPNVTDITFSEEIPFEVLSCLPTCFNALTSLSLNKLCRENYQNTKFSALKKFHLKHFESGNGWKNLVLSNRTIESLSFKYMYSIYRFDVDEMKTVCEGLPNFKQLKLGGNLKEKLYHFQNHIDAHPEELLVKIFGFLDVKSLKNVTLVNKRWYNIVNDTSIMKKLPLTIRDNELTKRHLIVGNRKFYKVVFKLIKDSFNEEMLSKLEEIGSNIREIEFIGCYVCEPKEFQNILRNFPKVEKITLDSCWKRFPYQKSNIEVLKLENLKELVLQDSCLMIFCCFEAQLKSLKFNMLYFDEHTEAAKNQQLMEFLYTQKNSVEMLELGSLFSNDVYKLIMNKFGNMKTLRINIFHFPANLKRIKAIKNVTKLLLDGLNEDIVQYRAFLSLFPNVTDISFSSEVPFEVLSSLPKCCNALTSLSLFYMLPGNYWNVKFSGLKHFHLEWIVFDNGWSDLVMCNRTIESLSFRSIYRSCKFDAYELKMVCKLLPNLKHLKLSGEMKNELYHLKNIKKSIQISLA